jgi:hypothetical protein
MQNEQHFVAGEIPHELDVQMEGHKKKKMMNSDKFEKWVNEKVIPNLTTPAIIVADKDSTM